MTPPHGNSRKHHVTLGAVAILFVAALLVTIAWSQAASRKGVPAAAAASLRSGRVFYVALDGRDSNPGTRQYPWRTVWHVNHFALRPGDTVLFRADDVFSDSPLMPGRGSSVSGAPGAPITFSTYGTGIAVLTRGIWLGPSTPNPTGPSYLAFTRLELDHHGFQGTGSHIALLGLRISGTVRRFTRGETGIETEGSHWLIEGNQIEQTGDSGMLLGFGAVRAGAPPGGADYVVYGNEIDHTGLDPQISYGTHGIYLKVAEAAVSHNWITNFRDNGISVRYRRANITDNYIAHGSIGIAWFQYDTTSGVSSFVGNTIADTDSAGIFVCGVRESCQRPNEHIVIERNRFINIRGPVLNLQPNPSGYAVSDNSRQR